MLERPIALAALALSPLVAAAQRPLTVEDVLRLESFGQLVPAPTGASTAVVVKRGMTTQKSFTIDYLDGHERADVWLVSDSGRARPITTGGPTSAGYWAPLWSPSGRRLAMLSTAGGDNVRLYAWDSRSGATTRLAERGVDLSAGISARGSRRPGFTWLDDRRLLVALLPTGAAPTQFEIEVFASTTAPPQWREAALGRRPTASVLDNAQPTRASREHTLAIIDVVARTTTVVTEQVVRAVTLAPTGTLATVVVDEGARRLTASRQPESNARELTLHTLDLAGPRHALRRVREIVPSAPFEGVGQWWSPDASAFVAIGRRPTATDQARFLVRANDDSASVLMPGFRVMTTQWDSSGALLALARRDSGSATRADWWFVGPDGNARNLTDSLAMVPQQVAQAGDGLFATLNGRVTRLTAAGFVPLTSEGAPRIRGIVLPRADAPTADGRLLVQLDDAQRTHAVLDLGEPTRFQRVMAPDAYARAELVTGSAVIWTSITPDGSFIWTTPIRGGAPVRRVALNEWLSGVADGRRTVIAYANARGDSMRAVVVLPPGYVEGKRYPTIAWVYAGSVFRDTTSMMTRANQPFPWNVQLLAARGYVVLMPTIPLVPEGAVGDPAKDLTASVLPAVDRLIALGIADSSRLAVGGHSYGGYTTIALLSQTSRFRAAIAMSSPTNLTSMYGTFDVRRRYATNAGDFRFGATWAETGQGRMGAGPWDDADRYIRNSPVFGANRIETPLLLIHGDMDYVPIGQAEEVYTALSRLGKRVRLARYWGEGHIFKSPANIMDAWREIFAWLHEHVEGSPGG